MDFYCEQVILGSQIADNADFRFVQTLLPREHLGAMNRFARKESLRVGILYGLRRTGKTVLLKQWLQSVPYEERHKTAYISIDRETMADVKHDLRLLREHGYKYIALDEITTCEDFIDGSAPLSNDFAKSGMKIFVAGTDSLSLWFAMRDALYDRTSILHTTYISYAEWSHITQNTSIDEYIRWGGLLHLQPTLGEITHSAPLPWTADEVREYFSSSVAKNIQNALHRYEDGKHAGILEPLLEDPAMLEATYGLFGHVTQHEFIGILEELTNINSSNIMASLQSAISHESHMFSSSIMAKKFKPADISRTASAFRDKNEKLYIIVSQLAKTLRQDAEKLLEVRSKTGAIITDAQFISLEKYMRALELLAMRPSKAFLPRHPMPDDYILYDGIQARLLAQNIVIQPGLRYAQADAVLALLEQHSAFQSLSVTEQELVRKTFLDGVYGTMQEDIILFETMQSCKVYGHMNLGNNSWPKYQHLPVFGYKAFFPKDEYNEKDKEIDMVIEDNEEKNLYLLEIKHSCNKVKEQYKYLLDNNVLQRLPQGKPIAAKAVLYRGETEAVDGIQYVNIEEYLSVLHDDGIRAALAMLREHCDPEKCQEESERPSP